MKFYLSLLIGILFAFSVNSQTNDLKCSIDAQTAALIKDRLMHNRANIKSLDVTSGNRNITYIPLTIHNVSNTAGEGRTPETVIMAFLCGLNAIYADQDVQFFIYNQIRNVANNYIDGNAFTTNASFAMSSLRVSGTLNLFIGRSINNLSASYYSGAGDYVFLLQTMLSPAAKTEAHEIGHFFTLPHTFYGWEGLDAEATYGGQAVPAIIGSGWSSFRPEAVARTGSQANCATRADGFCDTPADYYSNREPCPYSPSVLDPYGATLTPDATNLMSYAYDNCVNNFTAEQKQAIALDINARSWGTNTPNSTVDITTSPTILSPADNTPLGPITNSTVRLDWSDVTGATWYYIEVVGTIVPGIWLINTNDVIYRGISYSSQSHFDLSTANLVAGQYYGWRVKALNGLSTCAPLTNWSKFEASVATDIDQLPMENTLQCKVVNNPVQTQSLSLNISAAKDMVASIKVFGLDGREVTSVNSCVIAEGTTVIQLPLDGVANGTYLATLHTEKGVIRSKFIVQR